MREQHRPMHIVRRRTWQPTPALWPGESPGQRSLVGYSPQGHKESDTTELAHSSLFIGCTGSSLWYKGFSFQWLLCGKAWALGHGGFGSFSVGAQ